MWLALHAGRITASCFDSLMSSPTTRASTRNGVSCPAGTENNEKAKLRRELVVERITGENVPHPTTEYMKDGTDREDSARMLYKALKNFEAIDVVGFALHPKWDWFGASPDGLVGKDGGVELKCPAAMTHDGYDQDATLLVDKYKWQVLGNLICFPEREWWDLCSFHPLFPDDKMMVFAPRFHRSDWAETIALIEDKAQEMNAQIEAEIQRRGLPPTEWRIAPKTEVKG